MQLLRKEGRIERRKKWRKRRKKTEKREGGRKERRKGKKEKVTKNFYYKSKNLEPNSSLYKMAKTLFEYCEKVYRIIDMMGY